METPTYRGYVISYDENNFSFVSEHDKQVYTVSTKEYPSRGNIVLQREANYPVVIDLHPTKITGSRLYSACREYLYDLDRKKKADKKKREKQKTIPKPEPEYSSDVNIVV